jgi:hypothetical protein
MTDAVKLKAILTERLKKVPERINSGSYQSAVTYKVWVGKAYKLISNGRATEAQVSSFIDQYESFNR